MRIASDQLNVFFSKTWFPYSRYLSLTVSPGLWGIWVFGNHCQSFVVNGLSKSSFKLLLLAPNLFTASRWRFSGSLAVTKGILHCLHMTQMKRQGRWRFFTVAEIDFESIPATLSLIVFESLYCKNFIHVSISSFIVFDEISNLVKTEKDH